MASFDEFRAFVRPAEPLASLLWFRLGGPADYLARPRNPDEMVAVVRRCREEGVPFRLLAGGSNILARDEGVGGVVLHLESPAFSDVTSRGESIEAGAAVPLTSLISHSARAGLAGLERFTGIPGTVGGALRGNAHSRHEAIGQFVRRLTVLDGSGEVRVRERDELDYAEERASAPDGSVILSAEFELEPDEPDAVVRRMRRIWIVKKESQPYGHQSSGYIFRDPGPELSAGMLIEQAGLKGARYGGAEVSDRHANFIVAQPGAKSSDVLHLIDQIRQRVAQHFGHELELQIQVW